MGCGGSNLDIIDCEKDNSFCERRVSNKYGKVVSLYDRDEIRPESNELIAKMYDFELTYDSLHIQLGKPWSSSFKAPSISPPLENSAPSISLHLDYVYGYRIFDTKKNLFYTSDPRHIVYMAAALGIVLDKSKNIQRFFGSGLITSANGHSDDITALAMHPNRELIATGEVGLNPKILIWSSSSPESPPVHSFSIGRGSRGVSILSFSPDGNYLSCVDMHKENNISLFNLQKGCKVADCQGGPNKLFDLSWNPNSSCFVTVGIKHICFWQHNKALEYQNADYGSEAVVVSMTSAAWIDEENALTGSLTGKIYHWKDKKLKTYEQVHEINCAIFVMVAQNEKVFSGGKDGKVIVLNFKLEKVREYQFDSYPKAVDVMDELILVGTRDGKIIEIREDGEKVVVMDAHCDGEVWGLALGKDKRIVSVGDDNQLKFWDFHQRRCIATNSISHSKDSQKKGTLFNDTQLGLNQQSRSISLNPQANHIAIGQNNSQVTIKSSESSQSPALFTLTHAKDYIEVVQYSPNNSFLAVGSHDKNLYIYNVQSSYTLKFKLSGHLSPITSIDFSTDSSVIQSSSSNSELLYWDLHTGKQMPDGISRYADEHWKEWTSPVGWPVKGIFGTVNDYSHVNKVHRSPDGYLVAVGNNWGLVEIFGFPNGPTAKSLAFRAHSQHVVNIKWSPDGKYLFSAGGLDQTIMQWRRK